MSLKHYFEKVSPKFEPGGQYQKFYPLLKLSKPFLHAG